MEGRWTTRRAGHVTQHPCQARLDEGLGVHVEGRERVVEHEHGRAGDDRTGEGEPLPLPARKRQPLLADTGVEPPRQVVHEEGLGEVERGAMSSSLASGRPRIRFSRTLIENSTGSSKAMATWRRSESSVMSRMS